MLKKVYPAFLLAFIFLISFTSASVQNYPEQSVDEQFTFCQTCSDATYITLSTIQTPNSTLFTNQNMTDMGSGDFCYNYTPVLAGRHDFRGISDGCLKTFATYVDVDTPNIVADIILLIFFSSLILILYTTSSRVNYDKWYKSISTKYKEKNSPKVILSGMMYNLVKDSFLLYYLLGWPILLLLKNIVTSFGMTSISGIFNGVFILYTVGLLAVVVLFFGKAQEFIMGIAEEAKLARWGV